MRIDSQRMSLILTLIGFVKEIAQDRGNMRRFEFLISHAHFEIHSRVQRDRV